MDIVFLVFLYEEYEGREFFGAFRKLKLAKASVEASYNEGEELDWMENTFWGHHEWDCHLDESKIFSIERIKIQNAVQYFKREISCY